MMIITRSDISDGYKVAQSCHSIADFASEFPETFLKWKQNSNYVICLGVKNEFELKDIYNKFKDFTPSVIFYEPDIDEMTSVCLYGTKEIRKRLSKLPLLLKNKEYQNGNIR